MKKLIFTLIIICSSAYANQNNFDETYWQCDCYSRWETEPLVSLTVGQDEAEFSYEAEAIANTFCQGIVDNLNQISCKKLFKTY